MLKRLSWRIQPVEQIKKRKQRKRDMWELARKMHSMGAKNRPRSRMIRRAENMIRRADND